MVFASCNAAWCALPFTIRFQNELAYTPARNPALESSDFSCPLIDKSARQVTYQIQVDGDIIVCFPNQKARTTDYASQIMRLAHKF
jgi:hypothetical protein